MQHEIRDWNRQQDPDEPLRIKIGIHGGPLFAVNANNRIDYFGTTVNVAARIEAQSNGGDVVVTDPILNGPGARRILDRYACDVAEEEVELRGVEEPVRIHRIRLKES